MGDVLCPVSAYPILPLPVSIPLPEGQGAEWGTISLRRWGERKAFDIWSLLFLFICEEDKGFRCACQECRHHRAKIVLPAPNSAQMAFPRRTCPRDKGAPHPLDFLFYKSACRKLLVFTEGGTSGWWRRRTTSSRGGPFGRYNGDFPPTGAFVHGRHSIS
jgi:hypothetical protein